MRKLLSVLLILGICLSASVLFGATRRVSAGSEYTVTFYLTDGDEYAVQTVEEGGYALIPETPTRSGYVFLCWTNGGEKFSFRTAITGDISLYAEWVELESGEVVTEMFTVDFRVDGTSVNVQNVRNGERAIEPKDFALPDGKAFVGWDKAFDNVSSDIVVNAVLTDKVYSVKIYGIDGALVAEETVTHGNDVDVSSLSLSVEHYVLDRAALEAATKSVTEDRDIYLKYDPIEYTVSFVSEGAEYCAAQSVPYGGYARFPSVPRKDDHVFIGWYESVDDAEMYDFGDPILGDITLTAKFIAIENKKYSVKFYNYDGNQYGGTQMIEEGRTPILPGTPYREGYTFVGWFINGEPDKPLDFSAPIESDTVAFAVFRIRTYSVVVMDMGTVISEQTVNYGDNAVQPEISEKEGLIFIGFDESFRNVTKDTIINVVYRARTYAVMFFDGNYKKIGATQYVEHGSSATAPTAPAREGYRFVGWDSEFVSVTEDLAVFPIYEKIKFTYNFYDGESLVTTETVEYGDKAAMPSVNKEGFIFVGWYDGETLYDFNTPASSDRDLYARWEEEPEIIYVVTFEVDGAEYNVQSVREGGAAIAPADPVKVGYRFVGWDGPFDNVSADVTIIAIFEKNVYTVTFVADGYSSEEKVEYGDTVSIPEAPVKEGHTFAYWATRSGGEYDFDTPVVENITLTATFTADTFNVIFKVEGEIVSDQTVTYGEYASVPATPALEGHSFVGWFVGDDAFDFAAPIASSVVAEARFSVNSYDLIYYLNGDLYEAVSVRYGEAIRPLPEPEHDEWIIFSGWKDVPETMPARTVVATGSLTAVPTHVVSYYINGELYATRTYHEGETIEPMAAPEVVEHATFVEWKGEPKAMPASDVSVVAVITIEAKRKVTFYIDGAFFAEAELWRGEAIIVPEIEAREGYGFSWREYPETMPDNDLAVYGYYYKIADDRENVFKFVTETGKDGVKRVTLYVCGSVNVGGVKGSIGGVRINEKDVSLNDEMVTINVVDGEIAFVWSSGVNVTEEKAFMTFAADDAAELTIDIDEIYAFNEEGVVVAVGFFVD